MAKRTYMAMFEPTDGGLGISFPDLPGCVSFGADVESGIRAAEEALSLHLEGMSEDGDPIPEPSHAGDLILNHERPQDAAWVAITVEAPDAAERVNVYLSKSLLERIDRFSADAGLNRSAFFNKAARQYMGEAEPPHGLTQAELDALKARLGLSQAEEAIKQLGRAIQSHLPSQQQMQELGAAFAGMAERATAFTPKDPESKP